MTVHRTTRREFLKKLSATAIALGAAACAGPLLGGCAPARKAAEISLAASPEDVSDAWIARFNREFAPYHVTRSALSQQQLLEALTGAAAAADVVVLPALKIRRLAQRGALRDLAGLFQASRSAKAADLFGVDGYFTTGLQRWGIALSWSPDYLVWANTQLWQAAGVDLPSGALDLKAWRALSARLSAVESGGLHVIGTDFTFDFEAMLWLAETLDPPARLFSPDGRRLSLKSRAEFVEAARFVLDWKKDGGIPFQRETDLLKSNLPDCT